MKHLRKSCEIIQQIATLLFAFLLLFGVPSFCLLKFSVSHPSKRMRNPAWSRETGSKNLPLDDCSYVTIQNLAICLFLVISLIGVVHVLSQSNNKLYVIHWLRVENLISLRPTAHTIYFAHNISIKKIKR